MVQTKVVEKIKTHFMFNGFFSLNRVYNLEKFCTARQATDDTIIRRVPFECWINKATYTHSEYVIFIAFPLQQRLHEPAWTLHYTYIACLLLLKIFLLLFLVSEQLKNTCWTSILL